MSAPDIYLTIDENALFHSIDFDSSALDQTASSLASMGLLARSLLDRGAVPKERIAYLTDPQLNPGGRGKSRVQAIERNGTSGDELLIHPTFIKYIKYFVCGPDLPISAIERFKGEAMGSGYLTGGDINDLAPFARDCVRSNGLIPHHAAEEFFKLAIECGAMPSAAESIRSSVRAMKPR